MPRKRLPVWLFVLPVLVLVGCLVHLAIGGGSSQLNLVNIVPNLLRGNVGGDNANIILWQIRIPRTLAALLAGGVLGAVGAVFQAFFRNPLAEPYVIGVSSGAGFGGTVAVVLGLTQAAHTLGVVGLAFLGGLGSLWMVMALARRRGGLQVHTLLLAGVVVGAMLSAMMTTVLMMGGFDTGKVLKWLLGSLTPVFPERLWAMAVVLVVGLLVLQTQTRSLNAFSVSEFTSERLGVDTARLRTVVLLAGTAMVSVVVGSVGVIGFLGLMAPHIARRLVGLDLRYSLVASAFVGSLLLLFSDLVAQNLHEGIEVPVGAVTALLGAPALLWLLKKEG
ncbi:MAG TPA: iron ABC transporter permease [Fimbriimonadaceae bacterium]|nr:iron ABC transporter permease [Fimbriimonadaceae bacterium]